MVPGRWLAPGTGNIASMELRTLGHTGMRVSPLCLGAGGWQDPALEPAARRRPA